MTNESKARLAKLAKEGQLRAAYINMARLEGKTPSPHSIVRLTEIFDQIVDITGPAPTVRI